ncbi:MAG: PAS domain S-box protein [Candidatus Marinimicrobia bacterium]|nr:PAS domain S-box protein [Candidatus Neomarinimicrobiota bacterium]
MPNKDKILIVEDDSSMVQLLKFKMEHMGYSVVGHTASGKDAIDLAAKLLPDLVLMDILLEGDIDGIEATHKIRENCNIPVVYLTAQEDELLFQRAKITGPFGYLIKPFTDKELRIVIEIALYKDRQDKKLLTAQEYARNIINSSLDMIIAVDNNRKIIKFNKMAEETFGYNRLEVLGKHINILYANKKEGLSIHKKTIKNGRCVQEIQNRHKSGAIFPSLLASSILHDSYGNTIGVMGISRDITELKKTKKALKASQEYAKNLVNSSLDMIIAVDKNRKITEFNQSAEKNFGYRREEVIGKSVEMLYADPKKGDLAHNTTISEGSFFQEVINKRKNGEVFPSILSASVLKDEQGELIGVMGVSHDITDIKHAQEKLRKSEEKYRRLSAELYEANSLKELLLDVITHDLKNPSGVISGMAELAINEFPDNEMLTIIKESSDNLLEVIDNATTLSKASMGEEIETKELDLVEIIKGVSEEFTSQLNNSGMTLKLLLPEKLLVQANPIIVEVFKNYISNAINYAQEGKKILVEDQQEDDFITICIKDFGNTIPKDKRKLIFKRSVQLEEGKKRGRGLGLAIVKRIAEAHKGKAWIDPNRPHGNIFCLKIPKGGS